jgi:hypothetical protein
VHICASFRLIALTGTSELVADAGKARADDCGSLKTKALAYMPKNIEVDVIRPPISPHHGKAVRGFNHAATARLLCPMRYIERFDTEPCVFSSSLVDLSLIASISRDFIDQLRDGSVNVRACDLPAFLYDETQYNPLNKSLGLFRGYFLVRVRRFAQCDSPTDDA